MPDVAVSPTVDVAIFVPKADELSAFEVAFSEQLGRSVGRTQTGHSYWLVTVRGLSVLVVVLNDQTNSVASAVTTAVIHEFDPIIFLLVGTAMGREGRAELFDVLYSERVVDLQEWNLDDAGADPRPRIYESTAQIAQDAARLSTRDTSWVADRFGELVGQLADDDPPPTLAAARPRVHGASIAAVNSLVRSVENQPRIWGIDGRLRGLDMESGGFATALTKTARQRQWLVIRGVSDYGTRESKGEGHRRPAALAAALFARLLLEQGLVEADPIVLRPSETTQKDLAEENFYAQVSFGEFAEAEVKAMRGTAVDHALLDSGLSLQDFVANLHGAGLPEADAEALATAIRERYFTRKYADYDDSADLRSVITDWHQDLVEILEFVDVRMEASDVLYVGVGTGRDIPDVCPSSKSLAGVDVSADMLERAKRVRRDLVPYHTDAERLGGVPSNAYDVYLALRVFQSSLLSIPEAARSARRVLRKGGLAVISIPDAYLESYGDGTRVVRGLLVGSRVEHMRPYDLAREVIESFTKVGFQGIGITRRRADVYVWGMAR